VQEVGNGPCVTSLKTRSHCQRLPEVPGAQARPDKNNSFNARMNKSCAHPASMDTDT